ncbi:ketosteroid isomerase-like protein [Allocatelliglobosispora scoriae]|uniref:Ketosteroid isomerase-like protein n=1 Tax=Allocatelliglobosispora scoriae TaxID=643052 RepID=A0A841BJ35_9ACTN|nr:nuclear transport factor 2 family protein [Allocatelliglobosispora scoriae]MBB5866830.1 ketosteroid isomerase-like protein [Allocatelliglobosispora scoriae]
MDVGDIEKTVRAVYEAFNTADGARLDELFADEVVMVVPGATAVSGTFEGKAAVFAAFALMGELTGGTTRAEITRILTDASGAVVIAVDHATRHGRDVMAGYADVFDIEDGRVRRLQVYPADPAAMADFWR